ncbi:H-NS histone family protein [Paracoccus sp. S-4012]|uniref:H-NS histone family protein n=1 Tax=Paracoccus sp. S-4012 TaxID=2665648 RepID=UPI0012B0AB5C|nr:H-NS histone family protein [Paracoccus sp. S-4012]MRX52035.1 H-NS histone family protein [Paracoccus sp. S-4012]
MNNQESDLSGMDLPALKELRKKIDRAIRSYETRRQKAALAAVEQLARQHGFKLEDLLGDGPSGNGRRRTGGATGGPVKYVNPDDAQQTWSSRGRRPYWFNKALEQGLSLEDLAA